MGRTCAQGFPTGEVGVPGPPLTCPFCGEMPSVIPWHGGPPTKRMVSCDNEECWVTPGVTGDTEAEAITAWNTRSN